jgi:hypothetical protein
MHGRVSAMAARCASEICNAAGVRGRATYTEWATSAPLANGLDPSTVPPHLVPLVLDHLTRTGRALPEVKMVGTAVGMGMRRKLFKGVGGGGA